jgi:predicted lipoprotein
MRALKGTRHVGRRTGRAGFTWVVAISCLAACSGTPKPRERFARHARPSEGAPIRDAGTDSGAIRDSGSASSDAAAPQRIDVREACGELPVTDGEFSRERLRAASADCAIWRYCVFRETARALETAVNAYEESPDESTRAVARAAWLDAMDRWSEAELFQFGPAASVAMSAGKDMYQGKGLRDRIYAWPATAQCRVEEQVLAQPRSLDGVLISGRGLYAVEYALFSPAHASACAASSETATDWKALSEDARAKLKASYARTVAADVRTQSETLYDAWSPDAGNFKDKFVRASGYPDEQTALNVLAWALIYVEKEVKDWKLGIPAGYTLMSPVSGPEAPFAHVGTQNIRANLRGFRALFQGCGEGGEGIGFDDWLRAAGHDELAEHMIEALGGAEAEIGKLERLNEASTEEVDAAYTALRKLTDLLKSDLFGSGSPLNLKLPASVEGDTD